MGRRVFPGSGVLPTLMVLVLAGGAWGASAGGAPLRVTSSGSESVRFAIDELVPDWRDAGSFDVGLFYDPPWQPSPGELADETLTVPGLAADSTLTVRFSGLNSTVVEGWNTAAVVDNSDWPGDVNETDEWNNVSTGYIDWRRPFNFEISSSSASFQALAGSTKTLTKIITVSHKRPVGSPVDISIDADELPGYVTVTISIRWVVPGT